MTAPQAAPPLSEIAEARIRVLNRMRHDRYCEWRSHRNCFCRAGSLLMDLIVAERAEATRVER